MKYIELFLLLGKFQKVEKKNTEHVISFCFRNIRK